MLDLKKIECRLLTKKTPGVSKFKNSEEQMVNFIQNEALTDQTNRLSTTWVWTYEDNILLGFMSLAMFSVDKKDMPRSMQSKYRYAAIPSLLIGQLATHLDYEGNGIGRE